MVESNFTPGGKKLQHRYRKAENESGKLCSTIHGFMSTLLLPCISWRCPAGGTPATLKPLLTEPLPQASRGWWLERCGTFTCSSGMTCCEPDALICHLPSRPGQRRRRCPRSCHAAIQAPTGAQLPFLQPHRPQQPTARVRWPQGETDPRRTARYAWAP